jgi:hypothetical protein
VVVILVMNCELTKSLACEFTSASSTDPWMNFERLLPISLLPLLPILPGLGNDPVQPLFV